MGAGFPLAPGQLRNCLYIHYTHLPSLIKSKTRSNAFRSCFWPTSLLYPIPNGDINFMSRPSQKFLSEKSGTLQILHIFPLNAASEAALNKHRVFFFFCTVLKLNAWIWRWYTFCICLEAQHLANQQFSFQVFFITHLDHRGCLATIAFSLDI